MYFSISSVIGDFHYPRAQIVHVLTMCSATDEYDNMTYATTTLMYAEHVLKQVMREHLAIDIKVDLVFASCIFAAKVLGDEIICLKDIVVHMTRLDTT